MLVFLGMGKGTPEDEFAELTNYWGSLVCGEFDLLTSAATISSEHNSQGTKDLPRLETEASYGDDKVVLRRIVLLAFA